MTFKEAYLKNLAWQPDTTLRIMINFKIVPNFPI
jgi:hypothetical protein